MNLNPPSPSTTIPTTGLYFYSMNSKGDRDYRRIAFSLSDTIPPPPFDHGPLPPSASASQLSSTGVGGAGNMRHISEPTMFFFDEELVKERVIRENCAPVHSIGRGGAGNMVSTGSLLGTGRNYTSVKPQRLAPGLVQPDPLDLQEDGKLVLECSATRAWNWLRRCFDAVH